MDAPNQILVVDDSVQVLALVKSILGAEGYAVTTAESGEAALELVSSQPFDLVLMDATMPGMSGFDACTEIKRLPHGAATPVVFLTGMNDRRSYEQALEVGGDDFLSKPIGRAGLIVRVRALLRLASRTQTAVPPEAGALLERVVAGSASMAADPRLPPALAAEADELRSAVAELRRLLT
ncbi:MAG: response regulator [Proteobacteria bacterium]|nr:response regulator [Pseudomonadota bacterium]